MASSDSFGAAREFLQQHAEALLGEFPRAVHRTGPELSDEELASVLEDALDEEVDIDLVEDLANHVRVWPMLRAQGNLEICLVADVLNDRAWLVLTRGGTVASRGLDGVPPQGEWSGELRAQVRAALSELGVRAEAPLDVVSGFEWLAENAG